MLDKTIKNELESERPGVKKKRQDMRKDRRGENDRFN